VIAFDTVVVRSSCLIVFIVYLSHCICRYFFPLTVHVYSYIQLLAASVFIKFSVSVSVSVSVARGDLCIRDLLLIYIFALTSHFYSLLSMERRNCLDAI